ncbi:hypothetical protein LCGC14_2749160, partial [marine sediment metagenome]
ATWASGLFGDLGVEGWYVDSSDNIYIVGIRGTKSFIKREYDGSWINNGDYDTGGHTYNGDIDGNGNLIVVGARTADEDGNTATVRIFDTDLGLLRYYDDIANLPTTVWAVTAVGTAAITTVPPVDRKYAKKLVAIANSQVWYESTPGTMAELTTTGLAVNTATALMAFEGYQKALIVNGSNKYIADFINTKIIDAAGFTNKPSRGDLVYQAGASAAVMLVDYIDSANNVMYGYVISGTFEVATVITSAVAGGGDTILPSPDSVTAAPHWYAWTPYDNDTATYGSMPSNPTLGCLYRGRAVLSGDAAYPHQWYMSRQANIFDWLYSQADAQTPVAGSNADAGELGDVVKALIPYKDDYLIFGCSQTMWLLRGDPAIGGSLDELSLTSGIFGPYAYAWDNKDNLYYFGTNGIYLVPKGLGTPENI